MSGSGWSCSSCGQYVPWGVTHHCPGRSFGPVDMPSAVTSPSSTTGQLVQVTALLVGITALLEKLANPLVEVNMDERLTEARVWRDPLSEEEIREITARDDNPEETRMEIEAPDDHRSILVVQGKVTQEEMQRLRDQIVDSLANNIWPIVLFTPYPVYWLPVREENDDPSPTV